MKLRFVVAMFLVIALAVPMTMLAQQSKAEKEKEVRAIFDQFKAANLKGKRPE